MKVTNNKRYIIARIIIGLLLIILGICGTIVPIFIGLMVIFNKKFLIELIEDNKNIFK